MDHIYIFILTAAVCLTVIEMVGQYNLKKFNVTNNYKFYLLGIGFYIITLTLFTKMLTYSKVGIINHLWNIFSSLFSFIMAWLYFSETLTMYEVLGVMFSMIGIILMGIK